MLSTLIVSSLAPPIRRRFTLSPKKSKQIRTATRLRHLTRFRTTSMSSSPNDGSEVKPNNDNNSNNKNDSGGGDEVLVQYVVLRRDLIDTWPLGSVVTQGCHAAVAAVWASKDDPHTLQYCGPVNLDSMHKELRDHLKDMFGIWGHGLTPLCQRRPFLGLITWFIKHI